MFGILLPDSIRNMAKSLFGGFYELGISANKALDILKDKGLGYRRQDFLKDFAEGKGAFEQYTKIRYVNLDKTPSEGILEPKYFGVPDKYSMTFKANVYNLADGEYQERYFMYHRGDLFTRQQMENDASDWYANISDSGQGFQVLSIQVVEGYINPLWA